MDKIGTNEIMFGGKTVKELVGDKALFIHLKGEGLIRTN
jgi:hypothetical protein